VIALPMDKRVGGDDREGFGVTRLPGGAAKGLPPCPRPGHGERPVVKDGTYGSPLRQRFRCIGPVVNSKTGELRHFHRFAPELPRLQTAGGVCDTCDSKVSTHAGPIVSRTYAFPLREVSAAFVSVGTGASYTRAADRARVSVGRRRLAGDSGSALVMEWLDLLAPVVLAPHAETSWPETLVLDTTWFMANSREGRKRAFHILSAYGYPGDGSRPRVWALHASAGGGQPDWEVFLRSLDVSVPPRLVITDGDATIGNAVRAVWPEHPGPTLPQPFLARCEHHLHANGVDAMDDDDVTGWRNFLRRRLDTAFLRTEGWDELHEQAIGFPKTQAWMDGIAEVATQVAVRHLFPAHHSTAALDMAIGRVRDFLDSRSFVLRNQARTNLTLGLIRLHLNGADLERNYHNTLSQHLNQHAGTLPRQRTGSDTGTSVRVPRDQRGTPSLRR
jgi:hypothetical protein